MLHRGLLTNNHVEEEEEEERSEHEQQATQLDRFRVPSADPTLRLILVAQVRYEPLRDRPMRLTPRTVIYCIPELEPVLRIVAVLPSPEESKKTVAVTAAPTTTMHFLMSQERD